MRLQAQTLTGILGANNDCERSTYTVFSPFPY